MNYAIILAGGTGERMKSSGIPKQFLETYGKPIIIYTLETFESCQDIDQIIVPCNREWMDHLNRLIHKFNLTKVKKAVAGGIDRMDSISQGMAAIEEVLAQDDIIVVHDGVRPLVQEETIRANIEMTKKYGNAMTVRANVETVVVTDSLQASWNDFKDRSITYTLTSPQSFNAIELLAALRDVQELNKKTDTIPLLDVSMIFAQLGKKINLVVETGNNLKITTPEDYYYLKAYLELQESKHILGV